MQRSIRRCSISKTLDKHQLQHLLEQIPEEELHGWVLQYAEESEECRTRLRTWLQHHFYGTLPTYEAVREKIRNIFHAPGAVVRESNPRRWNRDWRTHWEQVLPELTSLFLWCCERCLKQEGTLGMLDSLMDDPANAGDWQKLHLLERRMELLRKWGREAEIPPLIRQYLYIPEVRRREVERLMQQQQWNDALILVQEGLVLSEKAHQSGMAEDWKNLKITLL